MMKKVMKTIKNSHEMCECNKNVTSRVFNNSGEEEAGEHTAAWQAEIHKFY